MFIAAYFICNSIQLQKKANDENESKENKKAGMDFIPIEKTREFWNKI